MKKTIFSKAIAILGSIAMLVGVAACGQSNDSTKTAADGNGLTKVTFMLSWAPDTNHIGVYVAKNKGYFKQAGLDVDIVAVAQAGAEQAVNNGMADFALSNLTNVGIYTLKGAKIKQVMQVQQKPSAIWCSLASNKDIKSPKDFDGKTFATFGSNESDAVIRRMIQQRGTDLWVCCFVNYESKVFEYLKKGTQVYVCGDVYADVFQKDDGSHIPSVSLTVSRIELLGKAEKKENGDGTATGQPQ